MLVAVTGASGHVGAALVRHLLCSGLRVRAIVRSNVQPVADTGAEVLSADVCDPASLDAAFSGVDLVIHLASLISVSGDRGGQVFRVNVGGARNVAEAAARAEVRRLVHVSSIHAYDHRAATDPIDESTPKLAPDAPAFPYDRSKAMGEAAVREVAQRTGLEAVIVQPTGIVGPWDFGPSRMGRVLLAVARRRLPAAIPGGFDWVDVRDVAAGIQAAAEHGRPGEDYILSGHYRPAAHLLGLCARIAGVREPPVIPAWTARAAAPIVETLGALAGIEPLVTRASVATLASGRPASSAKARRELGYTPRPPEVSVEDALRWFVDHGMLPRRGASGPP